MIIIAYSFMFSATRKCFLCRKFIQLKQPYEKLELLKPLMLTHSEDQPGVEWGRLNHPVETLKEPKAVGVSLIKDVTHIDPI